MPTKYATPNIVVGRITSKRIAAILAALGDADESASLRAWAYLHKDAGLMLNKRMRGASRFELARDLCVTENQMRDLERAALADLLEAFRVESRCGLVWSW
jgi:hypothetical protein